MTGPDRGKPTVPDGEPQTVVDRVFRAAFLAGLGALLFLAGALFTLTQTFPGPEITRAFAAAAALYERLSESEEAYSPDLWYAERRSDRGVTVYRPERAQDGLTLYASGNEAVAHLIDMDGTVRHTWRRPFSTVAPMFDAGSARPQPDTHVFFRHVRAFPNGDLLAIYEGAGDTPYGYGLIRLDRDSGVIWAYPGHAHHQFDIGPDGRIYLLTHEFVDDEIEEMDHLGRPRLEDFLVVLSPEGKELAKVRLMTALAASPFADMLFTVSGLSLEDPMHANSVKYIDAETAANFAFGRAGQILLSFRELHAIAVLDIATQDLVWATRGPWMAQHDPDILANGNITVFDNSGNYARDEGPARVIEFDPATMEIVWQYAGTPEHPLDSDVRGDQQRLANGNTLITEAIGGRIVEVEPDGTIAWEFMNPVRAREDGKSIPIIGWSERLDRASFDPALLKPQPRQE